MWNIIYSEAFVIWLREQTLDVRREILVVLELLKIQGPMLGRPYADVIHDSTLSNLKELRIQCHGNPYRAFFVFDPQRQAIILCAGNKKGNEKRFYKEMIPLAESIYTAYLDSIINQSANEE